MNSKQIPAVRPVRQLVAQSLGRKYWKYRKKESITFRILRSIMPGTTSSINTKLKQHLSFRTAFNNQLFEETLSLKFSPQQKELKFSPQYKENRLWSRPPDLSVHYAFESFRKDFWVTDDWVCSLFGEFADDTYQGSILIFESLILLFILV